MSRLPSSGTPHCGTAPEPTRIPTLADASRWRRRAIFADTQAETADWIAIQLARTCAGELDTAAETASQDASVRIAERARGYRHQARTERATAALLADVWS
ncbi:MAG: hypothetical protein ACT4P1_16010 [Sporichthyaceae bacterium]